MGFELADGIEHDTDHDQQGSRSKQLLASDTRDERQDSRQAQEQSTGQCDAGQDIAEIPGGRLPGPITWDERALLLQVFRHILLLP